MNAAYRAAIYNEGPGRGWTVRLRATATGDACDVLGFYATLRAARAAVRAYNKRIDATEDRA